MTVEDDGQIVEVIPQNVGFLRRGGACRFEDSQRLRCAEDPERPHFLGAQAGGDKVRLAQPYPL